MLSTYSVQFNSSLQDRQCFVFDPSDDSIVEGTESFVFMASAMNERDSFSNGISTFSLSIYDDDGMSSPN